MKQEVIKKVFIWTTVIVLLMTVMHGMAESYESNTDIMSEFPELLVCLDGTSVTMEDQWGIRKKEIIDTLSREIYGYIPSSFGPTTGKKTYEEKKCCSGHAHLEEIKITAKAEKGDYSFFIKIVLPTGVQKPPVFLVLNFRPDVYDMYIPTEEIIDQGFGIAIIYYEDIVKDDDYDKKEKHENEWESGVARLFSRPTDGTGFGKISLWAWGASRVMDYLLTRADIDHNHIAIIGHSRLGKAALWCAANDERFFCAISNCSGCGGASIERNHHEGAESVADIIRFDSWFCENYQCYADCPDNMPFDQHFLLAAIAPRLVAVGSANEDLWSDPANELLCCILASPVWSLFKQEGYIGPGWDDIIIGNSYSDGNISYHLRDGIHYLGRADWLAYMDFIRMHME